MWSQSSTDLPSWRLTRHTGIGIGQRLNDKNAAGGPARPLIKPINLIKDSATFMRGKKGGYCDICAWVTATFVRGSNCYKYIDKVA